MEFPKLGQHCYLEGCNQLDFLPAQCTHCKQQFCTEHLSTLKHDCPNVPDKILTTEDIEGIEKEKWQFKCTHPDCKVKELVEIKCLKCNQHFCLNHRHFDQHECIKDEPIPLPLSAISKENLKQEVEHVKEQIATKLEEAKSAGGTKGAMANKLALMRLKGKAKGDNAVPQSERVFFTIQCPNLQQNPQPLPLFFGKLWTLGKTIDFLARQARIKNRNNMPGEKKLHIFKGGDCLSKPFDITIEKLLNDGRLLDGDALKFDYLEE